MISSLPAGAPAASRRVETAFGAFDVADTDVVQFSEGIPGFERCRRFVLLSSSAIAPLHCLHAIEGTGASFLVVDPRAVLSSYRCALSEVDRVKLQAVSDTSLVWLALVTIDEARGPSVNLRAPIVINPVCMRGFQVMPHNSLYPLRHPLAAE